MKSVFKQLLRGGVLFIYLLLLGAAARAQGRVVVNEFMAWPGCGTTSEFIELLNFGPGPMNIGCYTVTNGQYAVTLPPNTILKPGQYYVLAGQDVLAKNCGNVDSAVKVNLNWTTCGCTDKPIPTSGDGFLEDGGNANEKIVLLDPDLKVVDAVSRASRPSASSLLTTAGGTCTPHTFDLDNMAVAYESIGISTGTNNSFARKVDGDCGWVKTTAISAGAPNKTGSTSSASYSFTTISAADCDTTAGKVSINVSATNVESLFPMSYILAYDTDSNGLYNDADRYVYGVDNSAPSIDINNLAYGRYRITVASALGCNLKTYDFFIFNCWGKLLPLRLLSFSYEGLKGGQHSFLARFSEDIGQEALYLEGAEEGGVFRTVYSRPPASTAGRAVRLQAPPSLARRYRLKVVEADGHTYYSTEVLVASSSATGPHSWPNPVSDRLFVSVQVVKAGVLHYSVLGAKGEAVVRGSVPVQAGATTLTVLTRSLVPGLYYLRLDGAPVAQPLMLRFVK